MSTWLYLTCDSHTPPIPSEDVGQHLYDLPAIVTAVKHREEVVHLLTPKFMGGRGKPGEIEEFIHRKMRDAGEFERPWVFQFPSNAARFLASHQGCEIGIQDEYGRRYDTLTGEVI